MLKHRLAAFVVGLGAALASVGAWAEELAVIIANENYRNLTTVPNSDRITALEADFLDAGFEVVVIRNMTSRMTEAEAVRLWNRMERADRLAVVLSGYYVRTGDSNWLLYTDADAPSSFTLGAWAFPVDSVMDIAARKPGDALVVLAQSQTDIRRGPGVEPPVFDVQVPQGVTYLAGNRAQMANFLANDFLLPGRSIADAVERVPNSFVVSGYLPRNRSFVTNRRPAVDEAAVELAFWRRTQNQNTVTAYRDYLDSYPRGRFANEARNRINEQTISPQEQARIDEQALDLTRDQRRTIQRNISLLGIETGGIDGIFGRRTRAAISEWQRQNGVPVTGFLNANQISRIASAAAVRAAELRDEAEHRRAETERADRQFWQQTGLDGTDRGLRRYLERFPDGLFADEAKAQLDDIDRQQRRAARREEREAWDRTVMQGTLEAYQTYLNEFPNGRFTEEAKARVNSLSRPETPAAVVEAAKREEEGLSLNGLTRQLIEGQLDRLGLQPGTQDGRFDQDTRRALRRYQRDNGLPVTGYVTRAVVIRLLASAVQQ